MLFLSMDVLRFIRNLWGGHGWVPPPRKAAAHQPAGGPRGGIAYEDEWLGKESAEEEEGEIAAFPTGNQTDPQ